MKYIGKSSAIRIFLLLLLISPRIFAQQKKDSLIVAQDGSGDFKTIQEAINAVRDLSQQRVIIHIKAGTYAEKVVVPATKINISLKGDDPKNTVITNADYSGKLLPNGKDESGRDKFSTFNSYTLLVRGNDFVMENL